ncbi:TPA: hypothetical protein HA278_06530 [Candidatus Woesearchaeota archaeon]|nr:hypothetical protein [archaeon]HIJ11688.1 hypothetical protein [Candidatus Woesearchaeota archaeon]
MTSIFMLSFLLSFIPVFIVSVYLAYDVYKVTGSKSTAFIYFIGGLLLFLVVILIWFIHQRPKCLKNPEYARSLQKINLTAKILFLIIFLGIMVIVYFFITARI